MQLGLLRGMLAAWLLGWGGPTRGAVLKLWDPAEREVVVGASRRWSR